MQIPLLSGITADETAEFRQSYPLNLEPVIIDSKISKGQLRAAPGSIPFASGPGTDRGGITWNDVHYRVMGTKFVRVNANKTVDIIGDVGGSGYAAFDNSFDRLGIASPPNLYYYDGTALTQVTDIDLGTVIDMMWIAGYFMTTDGTNIVVTELSDPTSILPLKYGSAESDPDSIVGVLKYNEEALAIGRYTIQSFRNVGGTGFPFQYVPGSTLTCGCVAPGAKTRLGDGFTWVGSSKGEALGVYLAAGGSYDKVSTRRIDDELAAVEDPTSIRVEARTYRDENRLLVHLPTKTWVYLAKASAKSGERIWFEAASASGEPYRLRNAVLAYGKFLVGDLNSSAIGELSEEVDTQFGDAAEWRMDLGLVYNGGKGGIINSLELVGLPGRGTATSNTSAALSFTEDGENFSMERTISTGRTGERTKRVQWRPHKRFGNWVGIRIRGYGATLPGFAACEADIEPLNA